MSRIFKADEPWPVGVWIRLNHPDFPTTVWFTYIDPEAGFSAATDMFRGPEDSPAHVITRLPMDPTTCEPLTGSEISELSLPAIPDWLAFYGPQPPSGTLWGTWRNDARLKGRFHPDYPDDLQVIVHDGGPRMTKHRPELIWVRVTGCEDRYFTGKVMNDPHQLESIRRNSLIKFLVPGGGEHPVLATDTYLAERGRWTIHPCDKCGYSEILDAPSDLYPVIFPDRPDPEEIVSFTSRCWSCGKGFHVLQNNEIPTEEERPSTGVAKKKWWRFGK